MNYKIIGLCVSLLLIASAIPTVASLNDRALPTTPSQSSELQKAFLFGRYANLTADSQYLIAESTSLWAIYKDPFGVHHYPRGTQVTFEMYTAYGHIYKNVHILILHVELVV
jgi:hypothetical protein